MDGISFARGLAGGEFPNRRLFWHFPHYTNQGSRPSGAVRDGNWLMIEFYDEEKVELYDLSADISEECDVTAKHPEQAAVLRAALGQWRRENDAQYNTPNPNFAPDMFQALYADIDASRFSPASASEAQWDRMQEWRKSMDAILRRRC